MKEYIEEKLNECCDEFQEILLLDKYVDKKMLSNYFKKNEKTLHLIDKGYISKNSLLSKKVLSIMNDYENLISKRNKLYLSRQEKKLKTYFDNMFKDYNDVILDKEQCSSIISDEIYSLIVSGPGSGKTTIAIAKTKYLVDEKNIPEENILLIENSKKMVSELKNVINNYFNLKINIRTINQLGSEYANGQVIAEKDYLQKSISHYIRIELFKNKNKLKKFIDTFNEYLFFNDDVLEYDTYKKYFNNFIDNEYEIKHYEINKYIDRKIQNLKENNITIKNEKVRSKEEVEIANYLYINGYEYKYQKKYPCAEDNYYPDFVVKDGKKNIYIEYYNLSLIKANGMINTLTKRYLPILKSKHKELHEKYNTDLIDIYSNENVTDVLKENLKKYKIKKELKNSKDIFYEIYKNNSDIFYEKLLKVIVEFLDQYTNKYEIDDLEKFIKNEKETKKRNQLLFIKEIYQYYLAYLKENKKISFKDIVKNLEKDKVKNRIEYIIIDDYQNLDKDEILFIKKISNIYNSHVVCLADSWQALFEYESTDLDMFETFYKIMGHANVLNISKSYRVNQEVIDVAYNYIDNTSSYSKTLISSKHLTNPVEIEYCLNQSIQSKFAILKNILKQIYQSNKNSKVLLISTTSINEYIDSSRLLKGSNNKLICSSIPNLDISFSKTDDAAGAEYDYVILLLDDTILESNNLLKLIPDNELIPNNKNRKAFYVSLTRTKNKLYVICPYDKNTLNINNSIKHMEL